MGENQGPNQVDWAYVGAGAFEENQCARVAQLDRSERRWRLVLAPLIIWGLLFALIGAAIGWARGEMLRSAHKWEMSPEDWLKPMRVLIWESVVIYAVFGLILGTIGGVLVGYVRGTRKHR